ncbi:hypothetical protein [Bosea beijingensis]|jgi:hypothetical protein|uniref:hypothetical protein n=1 Tax=Bosea beijingensis TaxID=3068632 RepID=UPI0027416F84|nr:hypothetical protein [Bosea sp. REN20]
MPRPDDKLRTQVAPDDRRQILLHLDGNLIKDLKKAAVDLETSASAITNEAVADWLAKRGLRKPDGNN